MTKTHLALAAALLCGPSCRPHAPTEAPSADTGIELTPEQIATMKIATQVADLQDVDDTVLASGKVAYDDQKIIHVFSPVSGKVVKVFAQLGDHVKKGDPLVIIESPDVGTATSDVGKAKADLIAAEHDYTRQKELLEAHAASQKDYETAADNYRRAKAELERAQQKAALFHQGDVVGQRYTLRSELDGEVFMKAISPGVEVSGQYGGTSAELFTIGETDRVWVLADVFEIDIARVKVGQKVVVNVVSWPGRSFDGKIDWISGALDKDTHATKLRCTFDNPDRALKPEMFATVRISVDVKKALAIPREAVIRLGDQTVVFVDRGKAPDGKERFERLPVIVDEGEGSKWLQVGGAPPCAGAPDASAAPAASANKWLGVTHGLERGDRVVVDGTVLLSGMM